MAGRATAKPQAEVEQGSVHLPYDRAAALRIIEIHREIARGGYPSAKQLARRFEVSLRTIKRDIEGLRDRLRAPIDYDRVRRGYFYREKYKLPPRELTEGEMIALVLGAGLLSRYRGTPFQDAVNGALNKVAYLFPVHISADLGTIDRVLTFDEDEIRGRGTKLEEHLTLIEKAIRDLEVLEVLYYTPTRDSHTIRAIASHHVHVMGGAIYVIAYCYLRKEMRTFAVDRMEHVSRTGRRFQRRADFSIEKYLAGSWGIERGEKTRITVRFDPETARFIRERRWHPSQVFEEQGDGSLLAQFDVAGTGEVTRWIRQYGSHAEVVGPEWLREEMRRDAERVVGVYGHQM
ncbi:MAG: helix-turn-helix transcriptional regulator [Bacillota bacterium]